MIIKLTKNKLPYISKRHSNLKDIILYIQGVSKIYCLGNLLFQHEIEPEL